MNAGMLFSYRPFYGSGGIPEVPIRFSLVFFRTLYGITLIPFAIVLIDKPPPLPGLLHDVSIETVFD